VKSPERQPDPGLSEGLAEKDRAECHSDEKACGYQGRLAKCLWLATEDQDSNYRTVDIS